MGKILAISNHKGGVGKTTSSINIGAGLAKLKKKVLLIDFDPQSNMSQSLNIREPDFTIYGAMKGNHQLKTITVEKNLNLIPTTLELSGAEIELSSETGREYFLKEIIEPFKSAYDYIIIDCPPSLGLLTINAFTAADEILIPLQAEYLALQGISMLLGVVDKIKKRINPNLLIGGIFITQFDNRKVLNRYVLETIKSHFQAEVFETKIRENISLAEAPNSGMTIFAYQPNSKGAEDYMNLCKEILKKHKI